MKNKEDVWCRSAACQNKSLDFLHSQVRGGISGEMSTEELQWQCHSRSGFKIQRERGKRKRKSNLSFDVSREQRAGDKPPHYKQCRHKAARFLSITKSQSTPITVAQTTVHTTPSFLWAHEFHFKQRWQGTAGKESKIIFHTCIYVYKYINIYI